MDKKFEDISIGDEVMFESTPSQNNNDLYWKVIEKNDNDKLIIVELNEMGYKDLRWTIQAKDIIEHIPIRK